MALFGSVAAAIVEFLGSVLALLVSLVFFRSELDHLLEKFVHIYGPSSAYRFLHPAFYIVYMILPMSFGLLGIVCACGLLGLREWARKGTLFPLDGSSSGLCVVGAFPSERGFSPRPRPGSNTCFWRRGLSRAFCVFARCPDPSKHLVATYAHSRKRAFSISMDRPIVLAWRCVCMSQQ